MQKMAKRLAVRGAADKALRIALSVALVCSLVPVSPSMAIADGEGSGDVEALTPVQMVVQSVNEAQAQLATQEEEQQPAPEPEPTPESEAVSEPEQEPVAEPEAGLEPEQEPEPEPTADSVLEAVSESEQEPEAELEPEYADSENELVSDEQEGQPEQVESEPEHESYEQDDQVPQDSSQDDVDAEEKTDDVENPETSETTSASAANGVTPSTDEDDDVDNGGSSTDTTNSNSKEDKNNNITGEIQEQDEGTVEDKEETNNEGSNNQSVGIAGEEDPDNPDNTDPDNTDPDNTDNPNEPENTFDPTTISAVINYEDLYAEQEEVISSEEVWATIKLSATGITVQDASNINITGNEDVSGITILSYQYNPEDHVFAIVKYGKMEGIRKEYSPELRVKYTYTSEGVEHTIDKEVEGLKKVIIDDEAPKISSISIVKDENAQFINNSNSGVQNNTLYTYVDLTAQNSKAMFKLVFDADDLDPSKSEVSVVWNKEDGTPSGKEEEPIEINLATKTAQSQEYTAESFFHESELIEPVFTFKLVDQAGNETTSTIVDSQKLSSWVLRCDSNVFNIGTYKFTAEPDTGVKKAIEEEIYSGKVTAKFSISESVTSCFNRDNYIVIKNNNDVVESTGDAFSEGYSVKFTADGEYSLVAELTTKYGSKKSFSKSFKIDSTKPSIDISASDKYILDSSGNRCVPEATIVITNPSTLDKDLINFSLMKEEDTDPVANSNDDNSIIIYDIQNNKITIKPDTLEDGNYYLEASAKDIFGDDLEVVPVQFVVDYTAPLIRVNFSGPMTIFDAMAYFCGWEKTVENNTDTWIPKVGLLTITVSDSSGINDPNGKTIAEVTPTWTPKSDIDITEYITKIPYISDSNSVQFGQGEKHFSFDVEDKNGNKSTYAYDPQDSRTSYDEQTVEGLIENKFFIDTNPVEIVDIRIQNNDEDKVGLPLGDTEKIDDKTVHLYDANNLDVIITVKDLTFDINNSIIFVDKYVNGQIANDPITYSGTNWKPGTEDAEGKTPYSITIPLTEYSDQKVAYGIRVSANDKAGNQTLTETDCDELNGKLFALDSKKPEVKISLNNPINLVGSQEAGDPPIQTDYYNIDEITADIIVIDPYFNTANSETNGDHNWEKINNIRYRKTLRFSTGEISTFNQINVIAEDLYGESHKTEKKYEDREGKPEGNTSQQFVVFKADTPKISVQFEDTSNNVINIADNTKNNIDYSKSIDHAFITIEGSGLDTTNFIIDGSVIDRIDWQQPSSNKWTYTKNYTENTTETAYTLTVQANSILHNTLENFQQVTTWDYATVNPLSDGETVGTKFVIDKSNPTFGTNETLHVIHSDSNEELTPSDETNYEKFGLVNLYDAQSAFVEFTIKDRNLDRSQTKASITTYIFDDNEWNKDGNATSKGITWVNKSDIDDQGFTTHTGRIKLDEDKTSNHKGMRVAYVITINAADLAKLVKGNTKLGNKAYAFDASAPSISFVFTPDPKTALTKGQTDVYLSKKVTAQITVQDPYFDMNSYVAYAYAGSNQTKSGKNIWKETGKSGEYKATIQFEEQFDQNGDHSFEPYTDFTVQAYDILNHGNDKESCKHYTDAENATGNEEFLVVDVEKPKVDVTFYNGNKQISNVDLTESGIDYSKKITKAIVTVTGKGFDHNVKRSTVSDNDPAKVTGSWVKGTDNTWTRTITYGGSTEVSPDEAFAPEVYAQNMLCAYLLGETTPGDETDDVIDTQQQEKIRDGFAQRWSYASNNSISQGSGNKKGKKLVIDHQTPRVKSVIFAKPEPSSPKPKVEGTSVYVYGVPELDFSVTVEDKNLVTTSGSAPDPTKARLTTYVNGEKKEEGTVDAIWSSATDPDTSETIPFTYLATFKLSENKNSAYEGSQVVYRLSFTTKDRVDNKSEVPFVGGDNKERLFAFDSVSPRVEISLDKTPYGQGKSIADDTVTVDYYTTDSVTATVKVYDSFFDKNGSSVYYRKSNGEFDSTSEWVRRTEGDKTYYQIKTNGKDGIKFLENDTFDPYEINVYANDLIPGQEETNYGYGPDLDGNTTRTIDEKTGRANPTSASSFILIDFRPLVDVKFFDAGKTVNKEVKPNTTVDGIDYFNKKVRARVRVEARQFDSGASVVTVDGVDQKGVVWKPVPGAVNLWESTFTFDDSPVDTSHTLDIVVKDVLNSVFKIQEHEKSWMYKDYYINSNKEDKPASFVVDTVPAKITSVVFRSGKNNVDPVVQNVTSLGVKGSDIYGDLPTAIVTVEEAHFDASLEKSGSPITYRGVTENNAKNIKWTQSQNNHNIWYATIPFAENVKGVTDTTSSLSVSVIDKVRNKVDTWSYATGVKNGKEASGAKSFIVDVTEPSVTVQMNRKPVTTRNGRDYYDPNVTATITVDDVTFNPDAAATTYKSNVLQDWKATDKPGVYTQTVFFAAENNDTNPYNIIFDAKDWVPNHAATPYSYGLNNDLVKTLVDNGASTSNSTRGFIIDRTDPRVSVTFDRTYATTIGDTDYYSAKPGEKLTATIIASDLNFDPTSPIDTGGFGTVTNWSVIDNSKSAYKATITFDETAVDQTGSFGITLKDFVNRSLTYAYGNPGTKANNGEIDVRGKNFVFDTTAPVITVDFQGVQPIGTIGQRDYYVEAPTAHVTVVDNNFDTDVQASNVIPTGFVNNPVQWTQDPNDHSRYTWDVVFGENGVDFAEAASTIAANAADKLAMLDGHSAIWRYEANDRAGVNPTGATEFTVDHTAPEVTLRMDQDPTVQNYQGGGTDYYGVASEGYVYGTITVVDKNFDQSVADTIIPTRGEVVPYEGGATWVQMGSDTWTARVRFAESVQGEPSDLMVVARDFIHTANASIAGHETTYDYGTANTSSPSYGHGFGGNLIVDLTAPQLSDVRMLTASAGTYNGDEPYLFYSNPGSAMQLSMEDNNGLEIASVEQPFTFASGRDISSINALTRVESVGLIEGADYSVRNEFDRSIHVTLIDHVGNRRSWLISPTGETFLVGQGGPSGSPNTAVFDLVNLTHPNRLVLDTTAPRLAWATSVTPGSFYNTSQAITLNVTELNFDYLRQFDSGQVVVTVSEYAGAAGRALSTWTRGVSDFGGGGLSWSNTISFDHDGHYVLAAKLVDPARNTSTLDFQEFTIDKTAPEIVSITYDNNDVRNEKYYKEPRTATITVREHNWDSSREGSFITSNGVVGGWSHSGDEHIATVGFTTDGDYTLSVSITDQAGNSVEKTEPDFTVDLTAPQVSINDVEDNTAYNDMVAPTISFVDEKNFDAGGTEWNLVGSKNGAKAFDTSTASTTGGSVVSFMNFPVEVESDDIYVLTAKMVDLAGNEAEATKTFSVNRFGSNFIVQDAELYAAGYLSDAPEVVVREINVSGAESERHGVTVTHGLNTENLDLKRDERSAGRGYYIVPSTESYGWSVYDYHVSPENFMTDGDGAAKVAQEGNYHVAISSTDTAKNLNNSASYYDPVTHKVANAEVDFIIDTTNPIIDSFNVEPGALYNESSKDISFVVNDNIGIDFEKVSVAIDGDAVKDVAHDELSNVYTVTGVPAKAFTLRDIVVTAVDYAGNTAVADIENFRITTNIFELYLPWIIGGAVVVVGGVVAFLVIRRRDEDGEEVA